MKNHYKFLNMVSDIIRFLWEFFFFFIQPSSLNSFFTIFPPFEISFKLLTMSEIIDEPNPIQLSDNRNTDSINTPSTGDLQNIPTAYRLIGKNYLKWSQFVRTFLKEKCKISHLLGTRPKPRDPRFDA